MKSNSTTGGEKIKKYIPDNWRPMNWNEVVYVVLQIVKKKKIDWSKIGRQDPPFPKRVEQEYEH
jgi:hypothetical protein